MTPQSSSAAGTAATPTLINPVTHSFVKPRDMTWHDQLITLLHLGAVVEHALMVQYLYAAYSMGGDQVPEEHRKMVKEWRESITAVAREEMGHLLTVQNILMLLGAGVNLNRERFPWPFEWFPLEPFSMGSLACYVYAEMPEGADFQDRALIEKTATEHLLTHRKPLHTVGEVYHAIIELLADCDRIPDSALKPETYSMQASWDEWGRGYRPDPRALDPEGSLVEVTDEVDRAAQFDSHVLIARCATRTQALAALQALSEQGEGPHASDNKGEWTHFRRFIKIFREYQEVANDNWSPTLPVAVNPNTVEDLTAPDRAGFISNERSRNWADLFNLRYRLLLTFLMHTYQISPMTPPDEPSVRAMLMHRVFGEMYHVKTIANRLVRMPLHDKNGDSAGKAVNAGPPFQLPYNMRLPVEDLDCWCLYLDILCSVEKVSQAILSSSPDPDERVYLETLLALDSQTEAWIKKILGGMNSNARYTA